MTPRERSQDHGGDRAGSQTTTGDRSTEWLSLLRRLTDLAPEAVLQGSVESGFSGRGDVDIVVARRHWHIVEHEFRRWAVVHGLQPAIVCRHVHSALLLVTPGPPGATFFELEVRAGRHFRGLRLFDPDDLLPLAWPDPRGFKQLRPGAEGLLRLVLNGVGRGGRPRWAKMREKQVDLLLSQDPEGVRLAARLFGAAQGRLLRGAASVREGRWDRRSMLMVESWALTQALRRPQELIDRYRFRSGRTRCSVGETITDLDRRVPHDVDAWISRVSKDHEVFYDHDS